MSSAILTSPRLRRLIAALDEARAAAITLATTVQVQLDALHRLCGEVEQENPPLAERIRKELKT